MLATHSVDAKINDALVKYNYENISNQQLAEHMGFSQEEQIMLTRFWEPAFNGSWIYLSPEMITEDMGYARITNFYNITLRPNYVENIDYVEINKNDELVKAYDKYKKSFAAFQKAAKTKDKRGGSNTKYYKVTGKTLKKMLMKCGTKKGDTICDYYLKVEQLAIFMKDYIVALHSYILKKQIDEQTKLIEDKTKVIEDKTKVIEDKNASLNRIHNVNIELLSFKKLTEKNESVYIVATYRYASQGIFKVGRTKCMKTRTSGHNNTHITGDKVKVLKEFKVNDSVVTENYIHRKLKGLLVKDEKEFFVCPYDLLESLIDTIINNDNNHNNLVNSIIDTVYKLKCDSYAPDRWITGIDVSIFHDEFKLIDSSDDSKEPVIQATFDVTVATDEQKKAFVAQCIQAYRITITEPNQMMWKTFQVYLLEQLQIPKRRFKALYWRPMFNEVNSTALVII
jgi:hypothetical protein